MIKISPFSPLFFSPSTDRYGVESRHIQMFAAEDKIVLQVLADGGESVSGVLKNIISGSVTGINFSKMKMSSSVMVYTATVSQLSTGYYSIAVNDIESDIFHVTDNQAKLECTSLIKYTSSTNRLRSDVVFVNGSEQYEFMFRVPGGFKDNDWGFQVNNEQFETSEGNIVELFAVESTAKTFTMGDSYGCPIWFGEHLNRILCCTHVHINGVRYVRKGNSTPEVTQELPGQKSYIFKVQLQGMVENVNIELPSSTEDGETESEGGGAGYVYLIKIGDNTRATDSNTYSALRITYELEKAIKKNNESLEGKYLRKDKEDVAQEIITFLKGLVSNLIQSDGFSPGEFGSGFVLRNDEGGSYLEIDRLLVRRIAYFVELVIKSLKHVGGTLVLSPASMLCSKVEEYDAYYRCYFEHEREGRFINQEFVPGDQARAQEFNVKEGVNQNVGSRFYWRLVIAVGDNYIDLSKSDAAVGSVAPQAGDDIVLLGNRDDVTRQNAIVLSTIGDDAPSIKQYKGVNSYSTEGKEITIISSVLNSFTGRFKSSVTGKDFDAMLDEFNTDLSKIKAQTDQEYTIWFEEYEPTLENIPACDWDDQDKIDHEYDIFYYSGAGLAWRFVGGQWKPITDQQTLAALEKAKKAQDTADKVTAELNEIVSDGILSKLEKKEVLKEWNSIVAEYSQNLSTAAGFDMSEDEVLVAYMSAYVSLGTYMNGGVEWDGNSIPAWLDDLTENQTIDADTYRNAWLDYYNAERILLNRISTIAKEKADDARTEADKANKDLATIVSDGILSKLEKKEVLKEWYSIVAEYSQNTANALKYDVNTDAYTTAYMALGTYMNGGAEWNGNSVPAWLADLADNQAIDSETYRSKWVGYYKAEINLLDAISNAINDKADKAQDTADNKRRNFVSQPVPPYDKGDTWSNAVYPESGANKGATYNNDDLVCITSKSKDSEFSIEDWKPASDMNSSTKKTFMSNFEQLEDSIKLEVREREALSGQVTNLGIQLNGAKGEISAIAALFDSDGNLIEGSGWVAKSDYAALYSQVQGFDGKLAAKAEISTSVQFDPQTGVITSDVKLSGDRISLEGFTTINNSFKVETDGTARIGGFVVSGDGLTNRNEDGEYKNDAYVVFRNDDYNCFAGIGGNVLPVSSGLRAVARFENHDKSDWWGLGLNCAMLVSAQGSDENIAIRFDGGSVTCLALKTRSIGHESVTSSAKPTSASYTLDRHVGSLYVSTQFNWRSSYSGSYASSTRDTHVTLPIMQPYDDGHVLRIKRGPNDGSNVYLYPNLMRYKTYGFTYAYELGTAFIDISHHNLPSGIALPFSIDMNGASSCNVWLLNSSYEILASAKLTKDGAFTLTPTLQPSHTGSSLPAKLQIETNGCVVSCSYSGMSYQSPIEVWGRSAILYDNSSYATPSSPLKVESQGDAMDLVYYRDLTITIDSVKYHGLWVQFKHPRNW